ncbi:MAG: hypothetical protein LAO03_23420 [Acidobacteriia bacterium]|nr:hypothetical protein [Terriglobia bacterium]
MSSNFDTYRLYYYTAPQYYWGALVDLMNKGTWAGRLMFIREGFPIPANAPLGGVPVLNYPMNRFEDIMSILRYEKPLYVILNEANGIGHIATSDEPVGELEPAAA